MQLSYLFNIINKKIALFMMGHQRERTGNVRGTLGSNCESGYLNNLGNSLKNLYTHHHSFEGLTQYYMKSYQS